MLPAQRAGVEPGECCCEPTVSSELPADLTSKLGDVKRGHENSQLNGISEGLCHQNGLNYVSCQSGFSRRLSKTQNWGLVAKLRLLRPFPLQQKFTGCFLFPRAESCGQHVTQGRTFIINNTEEERGKKIERHQERSMR